MKDVTNTPLYFTFFLLASGVAREKGYALTVHGTLTRDLDLVAVPWTDQAVSAEELAMAIGERCQAALTPADRRDGAPNPEPKPHGRVAYHFLLDAGACIDLSVMPRVLRQDEQDLQDGRPVANEK